MWAQAGAPDDRFPLTPASLLRAASHGGFGVQHIVKALFVDPWPEPLVSSFLACLMARQRCSPALSGWCLGLAAAVAAAAPSHVVREALLALWDACPG